MAIDWTKSMTQTFEYYSINPETWLDYEKIDKVNSCSLKFDSSTELFATASFECDDDIGEKYLRVYLVVTQGGITERFPLGVFIVQTPSIKYSNGRKTVSMDCYSPLIDLREKFPKIGYTINKNANVIQNASRLIEENSKVPLISSTSSVLLEEAYTAEDSETYLTYIINLAKKADCSLQLDETGRAFFAPAISTKAMKPVYTFNDDNSSLLQSDVTVERDLYGIPNRIEVVKTKASGYDSAFAINDDANSPVSTVNRGRVITERVVNPETILRLQEYAERELAERSCLEYTVSFKHGYIPNVKVGSCVRLNYTAANLTCDVRITSRSINCGLGCPCTDTGKMTVSLWR